MKRGPRPLVSTRASARSTQGVCIASVEPLGAHAPRGGGPIGRGPSVDGTHTTCRQVVGVLKNRVLICSASSSERGPRRARPHLGRRHFGGHVGPGWAATTRRGGSEPPCAPSLRWVASAPRPPPLVRALEQRPSARPGGDLSCLLDLVCTPSQSVRVPYTHLPLPSHERDYVLVLDLQV
jgi:hypothetical protein